MATHYPSLKTIAGLQVPYARHPRVRAIKRQGHYPSIHGTKLWSSSGVLIDYIASTTENAPQSVIVRVVAGASLVSGALKISDRRSPRLMQTPLSCPTLS